MLRQATRLVSSLTFSSKISSFSRQARHNIPCLSSSKVSSFSSLYSRSFIVAPPPKSRTQGLICQGIAAKIGTFYTPQAIGTRVVLYKVGGMTAKKGGTEYLGLPVFNSVAVAKSSVLKECGTEMPNVSYIAGFTASIGLRMVLAKGIAVSKRGFSVLTPRKTKYPKFRKGRCSGGCKPDGTQLSFGRYGIKVCATGRLSSRAIEAARKAISGQFRRSGKIWIRVFADIPVTGKPTEVRMGRGKGNVTGWVARVKTGQILFEFDGVSLSNAQQAAILASHKLCLPTKFIQWS